VLSFEDNSFVVRFGNTVTHRSCQGARLASSITVATAIAAMHATKTLHPPGGATSLIMVIGSGKIHSLEYLYVVMPTGLGALIMLVVALLVNNIPEKRSYPEFWI